MELPKQKIILTKAAYWLLWGLALYLCIRYLLVFLLPFLLGFLIAWILRPSARFIHRHSGMGPRAASIVAAIVFYTVLAGVLWGIVWGIVVGVERLREVLPEFIKMQVLPLLSDMGHRIGYWERRLGAGVEAGQISQVLEEAAAKLAGELTGAGMHILGGFAGKIPAFLLAAVFTMLSSVLICGDYSRVSGFVMAQIPPRYQAILLEIRGFLSAKLWKLLKAYLILMAITFGILAIGLWLLGIKGFLLIAALIAVLDLLPVIGSGVVLVPWGLLLLLGDGWVTGIGLLVLWSVISVVHQILEPKIVGDQIGLHPLVTLTAMYVGLRLAGFIGLLAAPVLCLLLQHMQQKNLVSLYRDA